LPEFTVLENVMIPMLILKKRKNVAVEKARKLLEDIGLIEREHHYPQELSGGEMQRVAIARALANDPPIVLMNEPRRNLDPKKTLELMELIRKLNKERG